MLARSKLNSIKTLISQVLIDLEMSHKEYKAIINKVENWRRLKENIRMMKSEDELNDEEDKKIENNKNIAENNKNVNIKKIYFFNKYKMFKTSVETYAENCIHTITVHKKHNKSVLWVKMCDIQDKLVVKNMSDLTIKAVKGIYYIETPIKEQSRKYKRYGKEFIYNLTGRYIPGDLALSIIIDCRTPAAIEFRSTLGFKQNDVIMTKEQSILTKIMKVFASEKKNIATTFCFKL